LLQKFAHKEFHIFCGKGNNGGDGLAIGRLLANLQRKVSIYILYSEKKGSTDFETNFERLQNLSVAITFINAETTFPTLPTDTVIIDALFGSGLNKPLSGTATNLVNYINNLQQTVVSIDLPSGMYMDRSSSGNVVIIACYTLTFQTYKLCFMVAENAPFFGELFILPIGLHNEFIKEVEAPFEVVDEERIKTIFRKRPPFAHKGNFGHTLIIGGSYGKMGAAVLATSACLRSGAGLVSTYSPRCGYTILQTSLSEAMAITDPEQNFITSVPPDLSKFNSIGLGPGLGTEEATKKVVLEIINTYKKPMVIDADGLNCLAQSDNALKNIPPSSILTPHPKEFDRLFGEQKNDFDRINTALQKAKELNVVIVLKSHHTLIASPEGKAFFNNTGNAGLAKGGSGDVLTGIISSLLGQGYTSLNAAILGVYLHGLAADKASKVLSQESMTASDLISYLSAAFNSINNI